MRAVLGACAACCALASPVAAQIDITVTYLRAEVAAPPVLSNLDPIPEDDGIAGAEVGRADNATTGGFMGHNYVLEVASVPEGGDVLAAARAALAVSPMLILDAPANLQLQIADLAEAEGALLFNASAGDRSIRAEDCRPNLLHTIPSDAMRTDALMQFLLKKRWDDLVLITGTHPPDVSYAEALRNSVRKFGMEIDAEKEWVFDADMRRNASQEVPLFTQPLGDYDVLLIADEIHDWGRYVQHNTWYPRPVAGSEGLTAVAWAPVVEQWGAAQLQSRFTEHASRDMRPKDYAAWAAIRSVGEAVTRTNSGDVTALRDYLLSDRFELAGFKGRPMNFRTWNGQMRQPIPLVHARALVAQAPLAGFLHQRTELDTLGIDEAESPCTAFGRD